MKKTIIILSSTTYAHKSRKLLFALGIRANIVKLTNPTPGAGCTYGIEFNYSDYYAVIRELKNNSIPYSVYKTNL